MKKFLSKFKYIVVAICCVFVCGVSVPQNVYAGISANVGFFVDDMPYNCMSTLSGCVNSRTAEPLFGDFAFDWRVTSCDTAVYCVPYVYTTFGAYSNEPLYFHSILLFSNNSFTVEYFRSSLYSDSANIRENNGSYVASRNNTYDGKYTVELNFTGSTFSSFYDTDFSCSVPYLDMRNIGNGSFDRTYLKNIISATYSGTALDSDVLNNTVNSTTNMNLSEYDPNGDKGTNDLHSLGHLENVKLTKFNVTDVVPLIMDKTYYSITYNFFTSTGFDLSKDVKNNTVQYCVTMQVYDSNNKLLRSGSSDYYLALDSHFGEPDCPNNLFWKIYINKESSLITGLLDKLQTSIGVNADNFNKRGYKYVYQFNLRPYCVSDDGVTYGQWTVLKNIYTDNFDDLHYTVDSGDNSYDQTTVNDDGSLSNKENSTDKNSHVGSGSDAHDAQQNADSDTTHDSIIDKGQDWINDNIINGDYNIHIGGEDGSDVSLKGGVSAFTESIYAFANLVNSCFSWAPSWVKNFFALSIAIFCIMILKRAIF